MALVYLCDQLARHGKNLSISDNRLGKFCPIIVDHQLREGSDKEAKKVDAVIRQKTSLAPLIYTIQWREALWPKRDPLELPNVETLARQYRYHRLGMACKGRFIASLLLAHHEDDQYETVLMKLLMGHGYRGLRGMRPANDIPACYNYYGVYQSGYIDDQLSRNPQWISAPTRRQLKAAKANLWTDPSVIAKEMEVGVRANVDFDFLEDYEGIARGQRQVPSLAPLPTEDGGVMMYRPLLQFSKDRLIATCLEGGMPWFEDHTNADPTFTLRNAIRYMAKNHQLPVALQKPAILQLSERCKARVAREEAEADRLFAHICIRDFESGMGTAVVQARPFVFPRTPRRSSPSTFRQRRRREHYRLIAAIMIRRLLGLVSPERELPLMSQMDYLVSLMFPGLDDPVKPEAPYPPKAYTIAGVHFIPLVGDYPFRWLLSRAPYPTNLPRPEVQFFGSSFRKRYNCNPDRWTYREWERWALYDGRYWVRTRTRLPYTLSVAPFDPEHLKPFREALKSDHDRAALSLMLKRYAPAKVRWTLPAIYSTADFGDLLEGGNYWPETLPEEEKLEPLRRGNWGIKDNFRHEFGQMERLKWENERIKVGKRRLLALPTLGFQLPGLENWLDCEFRYRKVDDKMLEACGAGVGTASLKPNLGEGRARGRGLGREGIGKRISPKPRRTRTGRARRARPQGDDWLSLEKLNAIGHESSM